MKHKAFKFAEKFTSLFLAAVIACSLSVAAFAEGSASEKNYIITNPYDGIDWDTWNAYKTQLHSHTNASDGYLTIKEYTQIHYAMDYDIVAVTDHGTINKGWNNVPETIPLMRLIKKERTNMAPIVPLSNEDYAAYQNGTYSNRTYTTKDGDVLTRTHQNGMLDVPQGIELNMATPICDCHLTGYFCDYGQGLAGVYGDYETPSKGVREAGGFSFLSHVGEYVYPDKDSIKYVGKPVDDYFASKFAKIFIDNKMTEENRGASLGMGINSATDAHTKCDRILYDQVLQKTIPNGVVPWGNSFADSHDEASVNDAYVMSMMPSLNLDDFRTCMEKGQFFAVSHYSTGVELNGMEEMPGFVEDDVYKTKSYLLDNTPLVTKITVDQDNDTITVEGKNANIITWVSNGNVIKRENLVDGKATLDLHNDELENNPYLYVRFYLSGDNGICYANPMVLNVEGEEFAPVDVPVTVDTPAFLRALVTVLDVVFFRANPIIWIFKYFALGYNPITWDRLINPF